MYIACLVNIISGSGYGNHLVLKD